MLSRESRGTVKKPVILSFHLPAKRKSFRFFQLSSIVTEKAPAKSAETQSLAGTVFYFLWKAASGTQACRVGHL